MAGTLYLVGTPIGNLQDITLRALDVLRATPNIAAEDTRRTRALLTHFAISERTLHALDAHASPRKVTSLLELLESGDDVALVSDAGMPSVSDPGAALVRAAHEHRVVVCPIPGPSAVTAAVAASGLVDVAFTFLGFLPRHGRKRSDALRRIEHSREPVLIFEAPPRMHATLADLAERMPSRACTLCREMSKMYEEIATTTLLALSRRTEPWRGEITLVIAAADSNEAEPVDREALASRAWGRLATGASVKSVVDELGDETALPRRELYALVQALRERAADGAPEGDPKPPPV